MIRACIVVVAIVVAAPPAFAQKFEFAKSEEVEKVKEVEWTAAAELGLVFTTGNSDTTTVTAGARATRKTGKNKLSLEGSLTYARSSVLLLEDNGDGVLDEADIRRVSTTTAETLAGKLRYDRFLTKYNSVFVAALAARDVPAGKESVLGGQIGYSRQLHKKEKSEAVIEIGYDFSRENTVVGDPVSIHSARGFIGLKAVMTEGTSIEASGELLTNVLSVDLPTGRDGGPGQDTRLNLKAAISAKIGKNLAVQTAIEAKYDHRPAPLALPMPLDDGRIVEAATLDTIMKASLIYSFF
jgi:hypothetical protein